MEKANRSLSGMIFNIQKFSVNDGPGIRTVVFFKGCPLRCHWCANPESQMTDFQILWDEKKCLGCHHCEDICPAQAISFRENKFYANPQQCMACGKCIGECAAQALSGEGEKKTVQEVLDVVLQDRVFYEESGGGITLSGGEFLQQPEFAEQLLLAAKEEGLHTCCETTGYAPEEVFAYLVQYLDYILYDLKHWQREKHIAGTGVSNELPVRNMQFAVEAGIKVLPRIPVIPGVNDSLQDAREFARELKNLGIDTCQLLPFHQFGENKYHLLNKKYAYSGVDSLHREDLEAYLAVMQSHDINAFF